MGFDLVVNFKCPYLAINPRDFWKRWHISLSTWLRDYLYIPLGGNRCGKSRTYTNLMITMLLGGLWHGAAWKFILWGLYHGVALVIYRLLTDFTETRTANSGILRPFKILVFFQVTCFGWLIFRCNSIKQIWTFPEAILNGLSFAKEDFHTLYMLLILVVPVVILDLAEEYANPVAKLFDKFRATNPNLPARVRVSAYVLTGLCMMTLIYLCGYRGGTEFIYFQF